MMRIADKGINKNFGIESSPSANSTATVHAPFDVPIAVNDSSTVTIAEPFQLPLFGDMRLILSYYMIFLL